MAGSNDSSLGRPSGQGFPSQGFPGQGQGSGAGRFMQGFPGQGNFQGQASGLMPWDYQPPSVGAVTPWLPSTAAPEAQTATQGNSPGGMSYIPGAGMVPTALIGPALSGNTGQFRDARQSGDPGYAKMQDILGLRGP